MKWWNVAKLICIEAVSLGEDIEITNKLAGLHPCRLSSPPPYLDTQLDRPILQTITADCIVGRQDALLGIVSGLGARSSDPVNLSWESSLISSPSVMK